VESERTPTSQSQHDQEVKRLATEYQTRGYKVEADIKGFQRPQMIGKFIPDIKAKKGGQETIIEVETFDSVDSTRDLMQQDTFQSWSRQYKKRHFKRKIV